MNIRDLRYIQAVSRHAHFGRAAEACNVSQPALSSQIKKLETELGVTLFERDNRSVRLTDVGAEIVALAGEALSVIDNIRLAAKTAHDPLSGRLSLGLIPTIAPYLIPHFVKQSYAQFPTLKTQFREDITERLTEDLLSGDLDAAILATPPEDSRLEAIRLYDEPFWVLFPSVHALNLIQNIRTEDLPADELLLLSEGHCFRDQALDVCQISMQPEARAIQATSLATLVNMVATGQGVTLVPALALNENTPMRGSVHMEKLNDPRAYRRIYLTHRKSFPRQALLAEMGKLICDNLPSNVMRVEEA